jgi:hypothetical protein
MKELKLAIMATALVAAVHARATLYDITFTGTGITATGQVDVNASDIATSGFLDVTYGTTINYLNLAPTGYVVEDNNGDELFGQDNYFNPNSATQGGYLSATGGLIFYDGTASYSSGIIHVLGEMALSNNGSTPNLNGFGKTPDGYGYSIPNINGTLTVALAPVPEASTIIAGMLLLLPLGASSLRILRRNRMA